MDKETMDLRLAQWMPIFEAQAKSGLPKTTWCKENGIRRWEFFQRQRECRNILLSNKEKPICAVVNEDNLPEFFTVPNLVEEPESTAVTTQVQDTLSLPAPAQPVKGDENKAQDATSGSVSIKCGDFDINVSGNVDKALLTTLIKAVANA